MKKALGALVIGSALALGACQEDATMEELIQDTELNETLTTGGGGGTDNDEGNGDIPPGSNL